MKNGPSLEYLKQSFAPIERTLFDSGVNRELLDIVVSTFHDVIEGNVDLDVTPEKLECLEKLIREIERCGSKIKDEEVEEVLLYLNFNSRRYFLYYISKIKQALKAEETLAGKLEILAYEYKKINQVQCEVDIQYTTKYPSLKDIIGNWISEEIYFLEKKRQLAIDHVSTDSPLSQDFKITLDMSVAQFTCLIRGFMERKLILNNNLTELAGFLSKIIVTRRSESISEGSFRRKYYNIEDNTKKGVVDMLNKTIDWLLKN